LIYGRGAAGIATFGDIRNYAIAIESLAAG
jgi:hypothetical protein